VISRFSRLTQEQSNAYATGLFPALVESDRNMREKDNGMKEGHAKKQDLIPMTVHAGQSLQDILQKIALIKSAS
jgi:hypothetical protein